MVGVAQTTTTTYAQKTDHLANPGFGQALVDLVSGMANPGRISLAADHLAQATAMLLASQFKLLSLQAILVETSSLLSRLM